MFGLKHSILITSKMTVRLQGIHQLLDAWLSTARSAANDVIASHQYEQASTEVADYVA